jgi:glycosyltransferase involved in cell wall biosynthesis
MRIAQVSPLQVSVPPRDYGGTERCIANLTESLVRFSHDVTLYASGDSQTSARLRSPLPEALSFRTQTDANAYHIAMLAEVYQQSNLYDIIHSHLDYLTLPFAVMSTTPTVITLHGHLTSPELQRVFRAYSDANYISISKNQQSFLPELNWVGNVYHSVDVDDFPFYPEHGDYLAFVGRISPEKAPDRAIRIALKTGIPIKIAAKVDPKDQEYFESKVKPLLNNPLVEFIGPVNEKEKREIMGKALALLVPINWPEPFGIVFIESLACGTPVITCPCGSVPELLEDGLTGYICSSEDELAEAALRIRKTISRLSCRLYAKQRFDLRRMTLDYLRIYNSVLQRPHLFSIPNHLLGKQHIDDLVVQVRGEDQGKGGYKSSYHEGTIAKANIDIEGKKSSPLPIDTAASQDERTALQ